MRSLRAMIGRSSLGAMAAAGMAVSSAAALPAGPLAVPGEIVDLQSTPDGGLRVLAIAAEGDATVQEAGVSTPAVHEFRPDGTRALGAPATGIALGHRDLALVGDRAIAAYDVFGPGEKPLHVAVRTIGPDGALGPEEIVSTPGREATQAQTLTVGPTGAVAFTFWQKQGRRTLQRLAFRPAGAARFLPPRTLGPAASESEAIILGPDGGGVVVRPGGDTIGPTERPAELRRLTPDGRLGKSFRVRMPRRLGSVASGVFAGKTFVLALSIETLDGDDVGGAVYTTSLAPRARRPTRLQRLTTVSAPAAPAALVADQAGKVTLIAAGKGIHVFSGPPGRLRPQGRIAARGAILPRLVARPSGALAGLWLGAETRSTDLRLQLAPRAPGSKAFEPASLVAGFPADPGAPSFGYSEDTLTAPVAFADGKVAIGYNPSNAEDGGKAPDATVLVTP